MAVNEVASPIELIEAPPGDANKYQHLVNQNQAHINRLKRLESWPLRPSTTIRRFVKSGPVMNDLQLHHYQLSEKLFNIVNYQPKPAPGTRDLIIVLFDFSGSMDSKKVAKAKDISVILAEGLNSRFDLLFYLYTTNSIFYELILLYNSMERIAGKNGLASITANGTDSGRGWNPDAAMLLTIMELMKKRPDKRRFCLIHLGDHEYCKSLTRTDMPNALDEVVYAVEKLTAEGQQYIAARIGQDIDPLAQKAIAHQYIHFPDGQLTQEKMDELYAILHRATNL
jgi:hypothetical protein